MATFEIHRAGFQFVRNTEYGEMGFPDTLYSNVRLSLGHAPESHAIGNDSRPIFVDRRTKSDTFWNFVKLIQATAWPVIVLFSFLAYRDPFSRTISEISDLLSHAREMKIGTVSFTIEQEAKGTGDLRLAEALKGLSPEARKLILQTGTSWIALWGEVSPGMVRKRLSISVEILAGWPRTCSTRPHKISRTTTLKILSVW